MRARVALDNAMKLDQLTSWDQARGAPDGMSPMAPIRSRIKP
jgi:hypothetical protein